jgi:oxygen-dependent protoporphyrinogen oxidase
MIDVLIAGGGISGLAAARDLTRTGRRVRLIEARPRLGGVIETEQIAGMTVEAGPDSLLMTKPSAAALCDELGLSLVPTLTPRTAYILRDGVLHAIPKGSILGIPATPDAIEQATMLSPAGRARLARDFTEPAAAPGDADDDSIGGVVRRRFGDEAVRYLAQPLLGGIHAGDVERLSLRALFPRMAALDREPGSLLQALAGQRSNGAGEDGLFRSIPGGLGQLVDAIARQLPADAVSLGTTVVKLDANALGGYMATLSTGERVDTRAVILAVPAYTVAAIVASVDAPLAHVCASIPYSSSATITLAYRRDDVANQLIGTGFVVPRGEEATRLLAASWVTSKWANRAPADIIMLRAFAGGTLDRDLLDRDDADLITLAHTDLAALHGLRARPIVARVYRWMNAGPQYEVGHLTRLARIETRLTWHPGLFITGSAFRGVGIPDTVADARSVAEQVHRWLGAGAADKMSDA